MFKIIRNILICLIVIAAVFFGFQWKNYQQKAKYRENALLYFKEEDYQKSIKYLEKGLKQMSFFGTELNDDMSCYLGESYYQLGEYKKAVKIYDSLLKKDSKEEKYYILKAEAYEGLGDNDKAVKVFKKGWKKTKDSMFLTKICDSYLQAGEYDKALKYAEKGVNLGDDNASTFLYKEIVIYEKCEDYQSAYDAASEYVAKYPDDEKGQKEYTFLSSRI